MFAWKIPVNRTTGVFPEALFLLYILTILILLFLLLGSKG
jgi:hypothetical protein